MSSILFQNAINKTQQHVPPIWFMRQAGRYHSHYQNLKLKHSFEELCKNPELAAEVAMGPIEDFDFDVAILFSDILFPLEALGMGLKYDPAPTLSFKLNDDTIQNLIKNASNARLAMSFQAEALKKTRLRLSPSKSLIGFVGGPLTLFTYAIEGSHKGSLAETRRNFHLWGRFLDLTLPFLLDNIALQLEAGAEVVMIFDTVAGEFSPAFFHREVGPILKELVEKFPQKLGYYSKGTTLDHLTHPVFENQSWAGLGVDHRWSLAPLLREQRWPGFLQGNFDQASFFLKTPKFQDALKDWIDPLLKLKDSERRGWVCGLGHGVLPQTPEAHVREFIETTRRVMAQLA